MAKTAQEKNFEMARKDAEENAKRDLELRDAGIKDEPKKAETKKKAK